MPGTQTTPGSNAPKPRGIKKSRASIACGTCRARKVRCSVASDGPPCTNCRLDGLECSVPRSRRGRRPSDVSHMEQVWEPEVEATPGEHVIGAPLQEEDDMWMADDAVEQLQQAARMSIAGQLPEAEPTIICSATAPTPPEPSRLGWTEYAPGELPHYITPITLPSRRGIGEYLAANEAFSFPATSSLLAEIIHGYLCGVHAYYPILDLAHILPLTDDLTAGTTPAGSISLLTFQAMIFAAIPVRLLPRQPVHLPLTYPSTSTSPSA